MTDTPHLEAAAAALYLSDENAHPVVQAQSSWGALSFAWKDYYRKQAQRVIDALQLTEEWNVEGEDKNGPWALEGPLTREDAEAQMTYAVPAEKPRMVARLVSPWVVVEGEKK